MKPYYDEGGITLYLGDCREILSLLPADSVDAVVTDPPFGIDFAYGTYDDNPEQYADLMRCWLAEAQRVAGAGPFFVWQNMTKCGEWHQWFPAGFRIFAACKGFVQYRPVSVQFSFDPVIFWGKPQGKPSVYRKDYHLQALAPFGAGRPKIPHPCPRPLEQVKYVVDLACCEGGTVLDPFLGSGTTALAAQQTGRRCVGIEREERYCELAATRLRQQSVLPLAVLA